MQLDSYRAFTRRIQTQLEGLPQVRALIAAGSMAEQGRVPDDWSDHDFFVITDDGQAEAMRQALDWLPDPERIVLRIRETAHGLKVIYDDGHLLEFAVFDDREFVGITVTDGAVLFDKADITARLTAQQAATQQQSAPDPARDAAMCLVLLMVGSARAARGETLSGHVFIKQYALSHLLRALAAHGTPQPGAQRDALDPFRRVEQAYPRAAQAINAALLLPPIACAEALLRAAEEAIGPLLPAGALRVTRAYIARAAAA